MIKENDEKRNKNSKNMKNIRKSKKIIIKIKIKSAWKGVVA